MGDESGSQELPQASQELVAGRYRLTGLIARGGMGEVFSALDQSTGRPIALKRLQPTAAQRGLVAHFMREFHALSMLRHPRIIEVYDYGVDQDAPFYTPFYTMELLDGQDLRDLSPLPFREACLYLRDVASSLALLHARRLLHRDVSPRNVRRTSDGRCKLLDFGAMIPFGVPPNVTGTVPCIPPEALHGASLDQRSDLYALGALAYSVLTGHHGYEVDQLSELPYAWRKPLTRPKQRVRELPDALDELVMSLLNLNPMKRPKSAAEVINWLSAIGQLAPDDSMEVARSFLTSSRLCGRAAVTDELTQQIERGMQGHGSAVLIQGDVGSGKSRMLNDAALIAQTCGMSVVRGVARRQRGSAHALAQDLVAALQQIAPLEAAAAGAQECVWPHTQPADEAASTDDAVELRAQRQQRLTELFCGVAKTRPLLLAVDDLERADEFSASLLAGLARKSKDIPLVIVAAETGAGPEQSTSRALGLHDAARRLQLHALNRLQSDELVQSMFGNVPNLDRLTEWMFRVARGNPKSAVALAEQLLALGLIRYVDGSWVLPSDEIHTAVPNDMADARSLRIQALCAPAVALAELLSVRRGGASAELCLAAGAAAPEQVFAALDELVREGVLESAGEEYVFAQDDLRKTLQRSLSPERTSALHRRWADVLLAAAASGVDSQLEAGWHLVHTEDELRGADLLAKVAPPLIERGLAMSSAIPALEKALEVFERKQRPLEPRLLLRSTLVLAGYLYDYRLAARYGAETLTVLHEASGLRLATRLSKHVGKPLGLVLAMLLVTLRRPWLPRERRGPKVFTALQYFVRSAMGLLGVRAVGLDAAGTRAILELISPLEGAPSFTSGRMIYLFCSAVALQIQGRAGELDRSLRAALHELKRGRKRDMSEVEHRSLLIGLLTADGNRECFHERSQALARADQLDRIGSRQAQAAALQIRMIYYLYRGDNERGEECRRRIDLHAIQGGKTWQVEWFSVSSEGYAGAFWTDLVLMRRSLDRIERLSEEVPSLTPMRDSLRTWYSFRRGDFARAVEVGESYIKRFPPQSITGWAPTYAATALSLVELDRAEEARLLCERGLACLGEDSRGYYVMYAFLEVAYATALAVLGQRERADEIMRVRCDRLRESGDHEYLVIMYQHQARMAQLVGDRAALMLALQAMRDAALSSNSAPLILLAERVGELRAKQRSSPLPPPADAELVSAARALETDLTTCVHPLDAQTTTPAQALGSAAGQAPSNDSQEEDPKLARGSLGTIAARMPEANWRK